MTDQIEVPQPSTQAVVESTGTPALSQPASHNYRAVQAIWLLTSLVTTLVAIRFVLKLLGASLQSGFVSFIYSLTDVLVAPFRAIFPNAGQGSTVDVASLVAIVIYALVGWGLAALVRLMTTPRGARSIS